MTLLLLALALAREVRLRRALQCLLRALLARFYSQETARESKPKPLHNSAADGVNTATAGAKSGTATISLTSTSIGTSGLANTSLTS